MDGVPSVFGFQGMGRYDAPTLLNVPSVMLLNVVPIARNTGVGSFAVLASAVSDGEMSFLVSAKNTL
jgi:hypothetical protein